MQHTANLWPGHVIPYDVNPSAVYNSSVGRGGGVPPQAATPVSTAMYGTTSTCSWAHTVPSLMPWMPPGAPEGVQENIVHFTAPFPPDPCTSQTATSWELLNSFGAKQQSNANLHLKRKNDIEQLGEAAPHKLCITEERMAARFKEMHISNQFSLPTGDTSFGSSSPSTLNASKRITNIKDFDLILNADSETLSPSKSLVLAPEIKKLVEPEKLFANTFLNKVERPTMALVLWEPQNNPMFRTNENFGEQKSLEEENIYTPPQTTPSLCNPAGLLSDICLTADKCQQTTFDEEMDD